MQRAIQLQPDSLLRTEIHTMLGVVWGASNDFLQATQSHLAAMELYPVGSVGRGDSAVNAWMARSRAATCADGIFCSCERCCKLNRTIPSPGWMRTPKAAKPVVEQMLRACPGHTGVRNIANLLASIGESSIF